MKLVIAEKPSVARDLARVLGVKTRRKGYFEGNGLCISWCFGHMCTLQEPAEYNLEWKRWSMDYLPMVPEKFKLRLLDSVKEHWGILKKLLLRRDCDYVVNACDAGREGELIFRYAYDLSGCTTPVQRLWVSSLTEESIQNGWKNLRPSSDFDRLADAARCRSEADWLVGMNATRAMTCLVRNAGGDQLLTIGRVQTPTLALIVERDRKIANFEPQPFWRLEATFEATEQVKEQVKEQTKSEKKSETIKDEQTAEKTKKQEDLFIGKFFRGPIFPSKKSSNSKKSSQTTVLHNIHPERFMNRANAEMVAESIKEQPGVITFAQKKRKVEKPPLLYDLNALQKRANQRFGFSAQKTLDIAQALYERHKLLTYPRTDAQYLTPDQEATIPNIIKGLSVIPPYKIAVDHLREQYAKKGKLRGGKRIYNASEVGDHHAILPTGKSPMKTTLSVDEKKIFDLVARRLLAVLSEDALFDITTIVVDVYPKEGMSIPDISLENASDQSQESKKQESKKQESKKQESKPQNSKKEKTPYRFKSTGKICMQLGWQEIDPLSTKQKNKSNEATLPNVNKGDSTKTKRVECKEGKTKPPSHYNEASLLTAMDSAGRNLEDEELKRVMRNAGLGTPATRSSIIEMLIRRQYIRRDKRNLRATDRGCSLIEAIPVEELTSAEMTGKWESRMAEISEGRDNRSTFMGDVCQNVNDLISAIKNATAPTPERILQSDAPILGQCPICGSSVRERGDGRLYTCDTGRNCSFVIYGEIASRKISKRMVRQLLRGEETQKVKGFKSKKTGKEFGAALKLNDVGKAYFVFSPSDNTSVSKSKTAKGSTTSKNTNKDTTKKATKKATKNPTKNPTKKNKNNVQVSALPKTSGSKAKNQDSSPVGMLCPSCNKGKLIQGRSAWGCNRWKEGCVFRFSFTKDDGVSKWTLPEAHKQISQTDQSK
jgi:DNA topoisomerase III